MASFSIRLGTRISVYMLLTWIQSYRMYVCTSLAGGHWLQRCFRTAVRRKEERARWGLAETRMDVQQPGRNAESNSKRLIGRVHTLSASCSSSIRCAGAESPRWSCFTPSRVYASLIGQPTVRIGNATPEEVISKQLSAGNIAPH